MQLLFVFEVCVNGHILNIFQISTRNGTHQDLATSIVYKLSTTR